MLIQRDKRLRVVFLDRDGVINHNRPDYIKSVDEFEFLPGALDALKCLNDAGFQVVVISNQACVSKGLLARETLDEINRLMIERVSEAGGRIFGVYYCTHRKEDGCDCRKPAPGLLLRASRDMDVDPKDTVFVGDAVTDLQAGRAVSCTTVLVLTGGISEEQAALLDPVPDYIAVDLSAAVDWIMKGSC